MTNLDKPEAGDSAATAPNSTRDAAPAPAMKCARAGTLRAGDLLASRGDARAAEQASEAFDPTPNTSS